MIPALGLRDPDPLHVRERVVLEAAPGDHGADAVLVLGRIAQVEQAIALEVRVQRHVQQAALAARPHVRHAVDVVAQERAVAHDAQPSRALGHQHVAVGKPGQRPRVAQVVDHRHHLCARPAPALPPPVPGRAPGRRGWRRRRDCRPRRAGSPAGLHRASEAWRRSSSISCRMRPPAPGLSRNSSPMAPFRSIVHPERTIYRVKPVFRHMRHRYGVRELATWPKGCAARMPWAAASPRSGLGLVRMRIDGQAVRRAEEGTARRRSR